jgi:hypothetical protein
MDLSSSHGIVYSNIDPLHWREETERVTPKYVLPYSYRRLFKADELFSFHYILYMTGCMHSPEIGVS